MGARQSDTYLQTPRVWEQNRGVTLVVEVFEIAGTAIFFLLGIGMKYLEMTCQDLLIT